MTLAVNGWSFAAIQFANANRRPLDSGVGRQGLSSSDHLQEPAFNGISLRMNFAANANTAVADSFHDREPPLLWEPAREPDL